MMALHHHNATPAPTFFGYSHTQPHHTHAHAHTHAHSQPSSPSPTPFYSQPSSPAATPSSSSSSTPRPPTLQHSTSLKCRPKLSHKKPSCSSRDKRQDVQTNLEMKVEKAKGFHAFFVPLGKSLPPAPPSSPVLGSSHPHQQHGHGNGTTLGGRKDYFEDWVEDVGRKVGGQANKGMDLD